MQKLSQAYRSLLNLKLSELDLSIEDSKYQDWINDVLDELSARNLFYDFQFYLAEEWFVADGHKSIAIPFYLFDPKLIKLEKLYFGHAEGSTEKEFKKLLRHELGHAFDNAFKLKKDHKRKQFFGDYDLKYPNSYEPIPTSKSYVQHLPDHYAQSHPDEDWAETFAVWLGPRGSWIKKYVNTPAIEKLTYMELMMHSIAHREPILKNNRKPENIKSIDQTVKQYLQQKQKRFKIHQPIFVQKIHKQKISKDKPELKSVLLQNKKDIVFKVAKKTNQKQYRIYRMFKDLNLEIKLAGMDKRPINISKDQIINLMCSQADVYFKGRHKVIM